jgi:PAS domain S-box-containing protein
VRHPVALTAALYSIALACCACAFALNPDRDIRQFAHRSWGEKEGYPGRTQALAQTTDGYLWLGSDYGVFRFDGVRFERYSPRSGENLKGRSVRDMVALPDGSLWIAYTTGSKICDLRNDHLKCYGELDGITSNPTAIVQDHEGAIWAHTETGLIRLNGTRWEHIGKAWNFPEDVPHTNSTALFVDSRGTLWVGVNDTVLYLKHGSRRFEPTGVFAGWSVSMAETSDGTIWLADNKSYIRAITTSVSAKSAAIAKCEVKNLERGPSNCPNEGPTVIKVSVPIRLLRDHNGSLWITTDTSGVFRISHPERLTEGSISDAGDDLQSFSSKDGLSADNCTPVLEDREGNIWLATRDGLDQFRDTALVSVLLPTSLSQISIAPADSGDIWVGSRAYVMRIHGKSQEASFVRPGGFKPYSDPAGITWLIGRSLEQWKRGSFHRVAQGHSGGFSAWQVAGDKSGTLWAFFDGYGFFSFDHGRWKAWATPPKVAKQEVTSMFSDSTGLIWVSTVEGHVITMDRGKIVSYNSPLRYVKAFAEHAPHKIWAGGSGGLALIDSGQFRLMKPAGVDFLHGITGIVDAQRDGMWLNTMDGVVHISSTEVDRALGDSAYRFQSERFDSFDGLPGQSTVYPYASAIQGTDGRIWFTATRGVAWIDPKKKIPRNAIPPPVHIERVVADGKEYEVSDNLRLPPHLRSLSFDYTALSLAVPEKVHFKVKLEGQDNVWRELLNVRRVEYTNLPPRHYTFRVMASNNSGVWNEVGASLEFSVLPAFYQTNWFRALCAVGFLALLWAIYRLRVQHLQRQLNIASEKARLYNELKAGEAKIRRLIDANIIGIYIIDLGGQIIEANDAFLRMLGYAREDLVSGRLRWTDLTPEEWRTADAQRLETVKRTGTLQPFEKEYFRKDGTRVPVLVGVARFEDSRSQAVVFALDLSEQKRAEADALDARVSERTRVARELHDTLLQNFQAVLVHMQAVRDLVSQRPEKAVRTLDDAIDVAAGAIDEGRDAIQGLRSMPIAKGNLADLLAETSRDLAKSVNAPPAFDLTEEGERRELSLASKDPICRIAIEILRNSYRHADAHSIEAEIRYQEHMFSLSIRDDGKGIDSKALQEGGVAGHFGLRGMRERAQRMGATLDFWTGVGTGTETQLTVPAAVAYENVSSSEIAS